ncbi:transcriptional regulator FtrA [Pseudomonas sp. NPDC007930]|uniref:transcriptional regulator FtrA n=1 Tax=Pseudomonas sp. NPDC007930 TaxID=3364417 RepID=UPI0036EF7A80
MHSAPGLVAILAYDGLCTFEFGIAIEVFALPRPEFDFPWYRHCVVAVDPGPLRALGGFVIHADAGYEALAEARTVIIPGWRNRDEPPPPALLSALRAAHGRGARLLSICSGAYVLAAAGLLDGQRATTHWRYSTDLAQRFPAIEVDPAVLYVDNGAVITSAGSSAGLDACLHLVERDFGAHVSNTVARRLVMAPQRSGGQAQFIAAPVAQAPRHDLAALLEWAREHLSEPLSVPQLAAKALMSERTFLRRFHEATGMAPKAWLQHARLAQARALLESTGLNTEQIAERCGFASVEGFRVAFRKAVGLAPSLYRGGFGQR